MRLAQNLTALRASCKLCLPVCENPTCSVPAPQECEGLWSYDYTSPITATQYHTLLSLEVATPKQSIHWMLSSICKSASKVVISRMQLTLHAKAL